LKNLGIVGAGGFFGLSFIDSFLNGKLQAFGIEKLTLITRGPSSSLRRLTANNSKNIHFINSDICALSSLPICDYWLHFAASASNKRYQKDAKFEFNNNIKNLQHFITLLENTGCISSVLFTSSGAVYKTSLYALSEGAELIEQNFSIDKSTAYEQSKLHGETIVQNTSSSKIKARIARCFSFCGPYLPLTSGFAIGDFISDILANRTLQVSSVQPVLRSYLHTDDLVRWLMVMVTDRRAEGEIFNVGASDFISIRSAAKSLAAHFNLDVMLPNSESECNSLASTCYLPDVRKASQVLGLNPSQSSYDSILRMAQTMVTISNSDKK